MVRHIRFHGRGGEGVKQASRILTRALFLNGLNVQDSPLYGAERRGAPVVAFTRFSPGPIHERGYIEHPDVVVLLDQSLLNYPEAAVLAGVDANSILMVNSSRPAHELKAQHHIVSRVIALDITSVALDLLGQPLLSAPMAGFVAKATALAPWSQLVEAVQLELASIGLAPDLIERNIGATQRVYDAVSVVPFPEPRQASPIMARQPFVIPRLAAGLATPLIEAVATSTLRTMEGWRVYRPVVETDRCTRCLLCFALCPEGAIQLDADNYPIIDYAHCKGCLVCLSECPPEAISQLREDAA